jgi:hypothetical protein
MMMLEIGDVMRHVTFIRKLVSDGKAEPNRIALLVDEVDARDLSLFAPVVRKGRLLRLRARAGGPGFIHDQHDT